MSKSLEVFQDLMSEPMIGNMGADTEMMAFKNSMHVLLFAKIDLQRLFLAFYLFILNWEKDEIAIRRRGAAKCTRW